MFKYNELSDLIDGSLVTPLSMEDDGTVLCLTENNEKKYYTFDDFDFSKKIEDRKPKENTPIPSEEIAETIPKEEVITEEKPKEPTINDVIEEMQKDQDDSIYDGTDDNTEIEPDNPPSLEEGEEGFVSLEKANEIVESSNIVDKRYSYTVWKDIV